MATRSASRGAAPLRTLGEALATELADVVSGVHILPFYPWTSDDGFSVSDYTVVDPALGSWDDLAPLRARYRLMYDAVINHVSAAHAWFQAFLRGEAGAADRFIILDPATDVSLVTRPRTHPLLTRFETAAGPRWVWTTFSADQIDLNPATPELVLDVIEVLLLYAHHGADLIRLDAIGYLWKQVGTRSIHLPQTHACVKLFRAALDAAAPGVLLITETNVPHADNISYFGDGTDEAQLVYQFPLAPLVLDAFRRSDARHLVGWARDLVLPGPQTTFFNFLASHDGIGIVPASGILLPEETAGLVQQTREHGGQVSYKRNSDGSESPYELNITLFDMLNDPQAADDIAIDRFVAAHAIALALQGVPGIYVHSLVGSHNNLAGLAETGRARTINREKWSRADLSARLADPAHHERRVFDRMAALIRARRGCGAFHPNAPQRVLSAPAGVFALLRGGPGAEQALCLQSVTAAAQTITVAAADHGFAAGTALRDLLGGSGAQVNASGDLAIALGPYGVRWLVA